MTENDTYEEPDNEPIPAADDTPLMDPTPEPIEAAEAIEVAELIETAESPEAVEPEAAVVDQLDTDLDDTVIEQYAAEPDFTPAADMPPISAGVPPFTPPSNAAPPHTPPPTTPPPHTPPPPGAAAYGTPAPPYRRLFRSRSDRKLGGVAGGLANYLGIDPTLIRIAFVVLALTGLTVLVYLAAWVIVPEHPAEQAEQVWTKPGGTDRQVAIAVAVGSLGLAVAMLSGSWTLLAFALIAGGIWLLTQQNSHPDGPPPPGGGMPAPGTGDYEPSTDASYATAGAPAAAYDTTATGGWGGPPPPVPPAASAGWSSAPVPSPAPVRAPRQPQRVTRVVLSLLALLTALGVAASTGDWWDVSATRLLGIGIVVIGVGVVTGAVTQLGSRWLIPLGILGLILLVPVAAVDGVVDDGIGNATHRPLTLAQLDNKYLHGIGEMTIDLRDLDLDGETRNVDIELGVGELTVLVSEDFGGIARMEADAGELIVDLPGSINDISTDGLDVSTGPIRLPGDRGTLDIEIELGLGAARLEID